MAPLALATLLATMLAASLPGGPIPFDTLRQLAAPLPAVLARAGDDRPEAPAPATYLPARREVTNWRAEAAANLDFEPADRSRLEAGTDPAGITRCVRLNNYWCIKKAGWAGELAADAEGHVAFSSSLEGAAVAAVLLRRYYLDYGRTSALAIVSRWAPASCGALVAGTAPRTRVRPVAVAPDALSTRGVGNTLRGRWLAAHRGGRVRPAALRRIASTQAANRSRIADRAPELMRAPSIMAGGGEAAIALPPIRLASLGVNEFTPLPDLGPLSPLPAPTCTPDTARVHAYAAAVARDIVAHPTDDLRLFEPDGTPTTNLSRVMLNMAAVEIGPRRVTPDLVEAAIAAAARTRTGKAKD